MKFQKDNSAVALTQKMKDDAIAAKEAELAAEAERLEAVQGKIKWAEGEREKIIELGKQFEALMEPITSRMLQYGTIPDQLDRLWHDIDSGRIQADKTSANSWYSTIKSVKDSIPIQENWLSKGQELSIEMDNINNQLTANNV